MSKIYAFNNSLVQAGNNLLAGEPGSAESFYQTSLWPKGTNKWVKIAFDRENMVAHFYVESTYVCTATMQYDPIDITRMVISDDQGSGRDSVNNVSIAAFTTLEAAKNYSGPF